MTRRTAIATLLRVAELQEAVARGHAAQALSAASTATARRDEAQRDLQAAGLAGGAPTALASSTQIRLWRADAVALADVGAAAAKADRDQALANWTDSRRRQRLLESLAARKREERLSAQEKTEQALADELAGLARTRR
jgi:hypothetical protein